MIQVLLCSELDLSQYWKDRKNQKSNDDEDDDDVHNDKADDDTHDDGDQVDDFDEDDDDDDVDDDDGNKLGELYKKFCVPLSATWPALPSPPLPPHSS